MKLEWILLAFFLISMVRNVAKSLRNPMLKNILRLTSILVAFIITFTLQVCGLFQNIASYLIGKLELASKVPEFEGVIAKAIDLILPFLTTFLSPLIFVVAFGIILLILKIVHVNLTYRYIVKRKRRKEIRALKQALREEKLMLKQALTENEEKFLSVINEMSVNYPEIDSYEYDNLDENEIERLVEQRIKIEKKKKKKEGLFKESSERKAISVICGVVCGFLLFGIGWMGFFYTMDVLSNVTDGIKETNASDTKIYQMVEMVDEHLVTPYEESFVYKLYDSMAMIDLLNETVRVGGKLDVDGKILYADDIMRDQMMRAVRLACEITSGKSEQEHIGGDIEAIIENPVTVSLLADLLVNLVERVDAPEEDPSNPLNSIYGSVLGHYQGEGARDTILQDMGVLTDIVVISAENKLLAKVISDTSILGSLITEKDLIKEYAAVISHLSFFGSAMEGAFTLGVDFLGSVLMPADSKAGYEMFVNSIVSALNGIQTMSADEIAAIQNVFKGVAQKDDAGKVEYIAYIDQKISDINTKLENPDLSDEDRAALETKLAEWEELRAPFNEEASEFSIYDYIMDLTYSLKLMPYKANDFKEKLTDEIENKIKEIKEEAEVKIEELKNELKALPYYRIYELEEKEKSEGLSEEEKLELLELMKDLTQEDIDSMKSDFEEKQEEIETYLDTRKDQLVKEMETKIEQVVSEFKTEAEELTKELQVRFSGIGAFIKYFMIWNNVQKPFMIANEDTSLACMALVIDGKIYMCNTDFVNLETLIDVFLGDDTLGGFLGGETTPEGGEDTPEGGEQAPEGGGQTPEGEGQAPEGGEQIPEGEENPAQYNAENGSEGNGDETGDEGDLDIDVAVPDFEIPEVDLDSYINQIPEALTGLVKQLVVTDEASDKASPLTDLIDYLITSANGNKTSDEPTEINNEWLYTTLNAYCNSENKPEACKNLANRIYLASNPEAEGYVAFDYKGATVAKMKETMVFGEAWTTEAKEADSAVLVDIVFTIVDLIKNMNGGEALPIDDVVDGTEGAEEGTEGTENTEGNEGGEQTPEGNESTGSLGGMDLSQINQIVGLLKILGTTMDQMAQTTSLGNMPSILIEGILKNKMLSMVMTPSMLYGESGYMTKIEAIKANELTYAQFMEDLANTVTDLIAKLNDSNNKPEETPGVEETPGIEDNNNGEEAA